MMVTADTITEDQLRALAIQHRHGGDGVEDLAVDALEELWGFRGTSLDARARCAEILNARASEAK
jgi:hypothetical protein